MDDFLDKVEKALKENLSEYRIEFLIKTTRSLKARVYLEKNYFIDIRHNSRNDRIDVALIKDNQRIFGYDNLKRWHYHPYKNPSEHIHCDPPSIDKIMSDTKKYYKIDKKGRKKDKK